MLLCNLIYEIYSVIGHFDEDKKNELTKFCSIFYFVILIVQNNKFLSSIYIRFLRNFSKKAI